MKQKTTLEIRHMKTLNFRGYIKNGKLALNSELQYQRALLGFNEEDKVVLTITPEKSKRSISQNNYLWLYYTVISEETGDDAVSIHEWAKRKFLPPRFIKVNGEDMKIPGSTADLSKSEFTEYIMRIEAETEIPAPDPEIAGFTSNKGLR